MQKLQCVATKIYLILRSERGEAKFDSALQIVISFVIGAIVLTALVAVFNDKIMSWLGRTVTNWFDKGIDLPSISPKPPPLGT